MITEILPPDTGAAFAAMRALRPHWTDRDAFVAHVDTVQRPAGYRLVGAFGDNGADATPDASPDALAVLGFRTTASLSWGRFVYVDDLSTHPDARRRGHAGRLLAWVRDEAHRLGCDEVHLDSGVGPARHDAHRLYLGAGYAITAHHFALPVRAVDGRG